MVHWQSHLDFLRNNFDTYMEYKNPGATLEESYLTGIFTTLKIKCKTCDKAHNKALGTCTLIGKMRIRKKKLKRKAINPKKETRRLIFI